jgi:hypothetical protein
MGAIAAAWGVGGVSCLLGFAIVRLVPVAWAAIASGLSVVQWSVLALVVPAMTLFEGYRGFQRGFSPRVAARARHLAARPTPVRALLAPLFCMGYFGAPRRRRATSIALTAGIVTIVTAARQLEQPWRGIVDAGVVVGLTWGLVSLWAFTLRAFGPRGLDHPAEVV